MKTEDGSTLRRLTRWEQALRRKHLDQIHFHEQRFGKLGELQTPQQKKALADANKKGA